MLRFIIYAFLMLTAVAPVCGQQLKGKSKDELQFLLQESKPDSNRVLILLYLGNWYLNPPFGSNRSTGIDTAIEIYNHAIRLSDTLRLESFKMKSMALEGTAWCLRGNSVLGKKKLVELAAAYHKKGDVVMEIDTWLKMGIYVRIPGQVNDVFFEKAITLCRQSHNIKREADVRLYYSHYLFQAARSNLAEQESLQVLELFHQLGNNKVANIYRSLSMISRYAGNYEKALSYAMKCEEIAARYNDTLLIDSYHGEMALVYDELGRPEQSGYWYRKTLQERIRRKADPVDLFRTTGFFIQQLVKLKRSKYALAFMDSLVARQPPSTRHEKGLVAQNYGYCYTDLKRYAEAEQNFLIMIACFKGLQVEPEELSITHMDIGKFYLQRGQFGKAHSYLDTALTYGYDTRLLDQKKIHQMLFTSDSAMGNYAAAIKDLRQYQFLNDSIYSEKKSRQIEELTIQYETAKKEQSIRLLEKEKRLQHIELTKEQNTKRWIVGVTLLLIVIIGLLINYSRLKQRTNRELQLQQKQIEKKNSSLQQLVKEKEWLVREIHHRVKNNFHIVIGLLRTQGAYLQGEEARQAVTESWQRIQAMSLVHQKLYQSDNLSAINIADYIHELIDYLKDSFDTGHTIRFQLQIEPVKLDVSYCIPLGLILNEAITNCIKHAFPDKNDSLIAVTLKRISRERLLLSIKDNGIGLPVAFSSTKQVSMGMKLMHGLGDDLDATFQLISEEGTEIRLDFICEI